MGTNENSVVESDLMKQPTFTLRFVLKREIELGFFPWPFQVLQVAFQHFHAVQLLNSFFIHELQLSPFLPNRLYESIGSNNLLQIFQQSTFMFRRPFWFHHRNLFHFSLQNQKSIILKINAMRL